MSIFAEEDRRYVELETAKSFFRRLGCSEFLTDIDKKIMAKAVNALSIMQTCLKIKDESKRNDNYSYHLSSSLRDLRSAIDTFKKINADKLDGLKALCLAYQGRVLMVTDVQAFIPALKEFIPDSLENFITKHFIPELELSEKEQSRFVFAAALLLVDELQKTKEPVQVETKYFFNKFNDTLEFLNSKSENTIEFLEAVVINLAEYKERVGLVRSIEAQTCISGPIQPLPIIEIAKEAKEEKIAKPKEASGWMRLFKQFLSDGSTSDVTSVPNTSVPGTSKS